MFKGLSAAEARLMTDESAGRLSSLFPFLSRALSSPHDITVARLFRPLRRLLFFVLLFLIAADGTFISTRQTKQITQMILRTRQADQTNAQPKSSSPYDLQTGEGGGAFPLSARRAIYKSGSASDKFFSIS